MLGGVRLCVQRLAPRPLQPHDRGNDQSDADEDGNQYQAPRVVGECWLGGANSCHGKSFSLAGGSSWHAAVGGVPENSIVRRPTATHHAFK
jgi:hypothetical protein